VIFFFVLTFGQETIQPIAVQMFCAKYVDRVFPGTRCDWLGEMGDASGRAAESNQEWAFLAAALFVIGWAHLQLVSAVCRGARLSGVRSPDQKMGTVEAAGCRGSELLDFSAEKFLG
jgi:hypothetical protein